MTSDDKWPDRLEQPDLELQKLRGCLALLVSAPDLSAADLI